MPRPPPDFHGFFGQRRVVNYVQRRVKGARSRGMPCPSLLLVAPTGFGKTLLAARIAKEYGDTKYFQILANNKLAPDDLREILRQIEFGDFVFVDEIHSLRSDAQQFLYVALDEQKMPSSSHGPELESVAPFTLIGATDMPGLIQHAFFNRFKLIRFESYEIAELKKIAESVALNSGNGLTPQAARRIADSAQGRPREVRKRIEALQDLFPEPIRGRWTQDNVEEVLQAEGIDKLGLSSEQRTYLLRLLKDSCGCCSLNTLALELADIKFVAREIEPFLVKLGLVCLEQRGRKLTNSGRKIAEEIRTRLERQEEEEGDLSSDSNLSEYKIKKA